MKTKIFFFITLSLLVSITSCSQKKDCDQIAKQFETYDKAVEQIKSINFKIQETLNTSKSSWIKNASYYSCDGITGYFILKTSKKEILIC